MSYLLMSVGIYGILTLVTYFVDIDGWLWRSLAMITGVVAVMVFDSLGLWYLGFGVGGGASLILHLDDLMITRADEAKSNVLNRNRSRPPF